MAPFLEKEAERYLSQVSEWKLDSNAKKISKEFTFKNFLEAMHFVEEVAKIAESEGHHPDIFIHYNKVILTLWTHAIGGLSENDFIVAAKVNLLK